MATRMRFACEFCATRPDEETQRSLLGTLRHTDAPPLVDALPGRWLVWRGGGPLGARRYACAEHRGELTAYLRLHYAAVSGCVWQRPPYPQAWPDGTRRSAAEAPVAPARTPRPADGFLALSRRPDPPLDDLLLALAGEFRPVDRRLAQDRLDDFSRCLFGLDGLDATGQAGCVAHALRHDLAMAPGDPRDPEGLLLDRVLECRTGHPLVLAVIAVELARRAGATAWVCSAPTRLFAGFGHESPRLVETTAPVRTAPDTATVVRHCSHAVAFGIVGGLCESYARLPAGPEARRALGLQRAMREERAAAHRRS